MNALQQVQSKRTDGPQRKPFYSDMSLWSIVAANLIVIVLSQMYNWSLASLIWTYWCQSLIAGLFWFFRIMELKDFDAPSSMIEDNLRKLAADHLGAQESPMETAFKAKSELAAGQLFLLISIHVGIIFWIRPLISESASWNFWNVAIGASLFFVSQCIAYPKSNRWIAGRRPTATIIGIPHISTAPMYLAMLAMAHYATADTLLLFLAAKTVADVTIHAVQYSCFGDGAYSEKTFLDYEPAGPDSERCEFCNRTIRDSETPYVIKEHIVCRQCYESIRKEKERHNHA
jgi:hypothetical protein